MTLDANTSSKIASAIHTAQTQDEHPGEVHVHVAKKRKHITPANPFALCFVGSLAKIIQRHKLPASSVALLFLLLDLSQFGNLISVNQQELAARLGVKQPAVSKALAKLVDAGIILNLPEGQFFNPQLITRQGLDTVAQKYPQQVAAGLAALLEKNGMAPNWELPTAQTAGA
ncbi:MAG: MarR family transcriptional regulator [Pseudoxanthomonas sp.]